MNAVHHNPQARDVIAEIDNIISSIHEDLRHSRLLTISLRRRQSGRERLVSFPASTAAEAKRFTAILQILHLSRRALIEDRVITKRAIYYQNPGLFGSQQYVDDLVDDIAFTFGVGRRALNIVAVDKGLIAGNLAITTINGTTLRCSPLNRQGIALPDMTTITGFHATELKWVLLIEKEATFRGLVSSGFYDSATIGPGLLVTAKGYPDLSTRRFVHELQTSAPWLPMYALVDFDPHGLQIMLTYKHGSRSLRHEEHVTLPRLVWIGPKSDDIRAVAGKILPLASDRLHNETSRSQSDEAVHGQAVDNALFNNMLELTVRDRRLILRLLTEAVGRDPQDPSLIREMQVMLMLNTKAEIQCVDDGGDVTTWLDAALFQAYTAS
ncbi:Spo11/DNA topoisomerase VI subunit A [Xylariaceae sp. FL0255]|nr:Spo11/DNA topoisomerase VI subunit A [Xylariaceae sp. FL0255]